MSNQIERLETKQRMSRAVIYHGTIYLCGQVARDSTQGITEQTRTTLEKIDELLEKAGSDKSKILSATVYIRDMNLFKEMNAVWDAWVPTGKAPARTCVEANMARQEILVEITVTAAV